MVGPVKPETVNVQGFLFSLALEAIRLSLDGWERVAALVFLATMNHSDIRGLVTARLVSVGGCLCLRTDVTPSIGQSVVPGWVEDSPIVHTSAVTLSSSFWGYCFDLFDT